MTDFKRQGWISILLLSVVTLGIYIPFWYKKCKRVTDELLIEKKLQSKYITIFLVLIILRIPFNITLKWTANEQAQIFTTNYYNIGDILTLATIGLAIFIAFELRSVLLQHYSMDINEVWTILLGPMYLQEKINGTIETPSTQTTPVQTEEIFHEGETKQTPIQNTNQTTDKPL